MEELNISSAAANKHWVEELFPPTFGITADELVSDLGNEDITEPSLFDRFARRVHPQDTDAIKNVYERVWLMTALENEEKEKKKQEKEAIGGLAAIQTRMSGLKVRDANTSTTDFEKQVKYNIHDPCIWSESEIQVLREVFQAARTQNQELQVQLAEITERYNSLSKNQKQQTQTLDSKTAQLEEALRANCRLQILSENLHKELKKAKADVDIWKKEVEILKRQRKDYMEQLHEVQIKYNQEHLEKSKITRDLQKRSKDALQEQILREEKLKVSHIHNISSLQKKLERVTSELEEEKKSHERDKRGLDHLRTHFASLPHIEQLTQNSGMVTEDQLKTWSY